LRLNAGVRWTDDEKEANGNTTDTVIPGLGTIPGAPLDGEKADDDEFTGQIGLEYDLSDDLFTYVRIAKGYKAGGINNNSGNPYEPEDLISYEVGLKGSPTESTTMSFAAFYSEYEDIQVFVPGPSGIPDILNAAEATISGIDFDGNWYLSEAFSLDLQFTWLIEAEYDEFDVAGVDYSGAQLTRSPEFTGIFGVNWYHNLTDRIRLSSRAEVYTTSDIAFSYLAETNPDALEEDGYELVNVFVTATWDEKLDISLYGKNITDEDYKSLAVEGSEGIQYAGFGRPDEYGVEVRYLF